MKSKIIIAGIVLTISSLCFLPTVALAEIFHLTCVSTNIPEWIDKITVDSGKNTVFFPEFDAVATNVFISEQRIKFIVHMPAKSIAYSINRVDGIGEASIAGELKCKKSKGSKPKRAF